ncbi:DNA polymerase III subunit epsilon [Streptomyces avidinii]
MRLPLLECRPLTEWSDSAATPRDAYSRQQLAALAKRPPCPHPNPGRFEDGKPLKQGMRIAFSGDTSVERELLEDRAVEAGLHIATSVSRLTSLLVTNDPDSATSKTVKAKSFGTPVVDEAAFTQLLRDVAPAES